MRNKYLCHCLQGGMFVFQLFDYYACNGACLLFLCVFETLALGWIFGRCALAFISHTNDVVTMTRSGKFSQI